jgi:hypothetical protein
MKREETFEDITYRLIRKINERERKLLSLHMINAINHHSFNISLPSGKYKLNITRCN